MDTLSSYSKNENNFGLENDAESNFKSHSGSSSCVPEEAAQSFHQSYLANNDHSNTFQHPGLSNRPNKQFAHQAYQQNYIINSPVRSTPSSFINENKNISVTHAPPVWAHPPRFNQYSQLPSPLCQNRMPVGAMRRSSVDQKLQMNTSTVINETSLDFKQHLKQANQLPNLPLKNPFMQELCFPRSLDRCHHLSSNITNFPQTSSHSHMSSSSIGNSRPSIDSQHDHSNNLNQTHHFPFRGTRSSSPVWDAEAGLFNENFGNCVPPSLHTSSAHTQLQMPAGSTLLQDLRTPSQPNLLRPDNSPIKHAFNSALVSQSQTSHLGIGTDSSDFKSLSAPPYASIIPSAMQHYFQQSEYPNIGAPLYHLQLMQNRSLLPQSKPLEADMPVSSPSHSYHTTGKGRLPSFVSNQLPLVNASVQPHYSDSQATRQLPQSHMSDPSVPHQTQLLRPPDPHFQMQQNISPTKCPDLLLPHSHQSNLLLQNTAQGIDSNALQRSLPASVQFNQMDCVEGPHITSPPATYPSMPPIQSQMMRFESTTYKSSTRSSQVVPYQLPTRETDIGEAQQQDSISHAKPSNINIIDEPICSIQVNKVAPDQVQRKGRASKTPGGQKTPSSRNKSKILSAKKESNAKLPTEVSNVTGIAHGPRMQAISNSSISIERYSKKTAPNTIKVGIEDLQKETSCKKLKTQNSKSRKPYSKRSPESSTADCQLNISKTMKWYREPEEESSLTKGSLQSNTDIANYQPGPQQKPVHFIDSSDVVTEEKVIAKKNKEDNNVRQTHTVCKNCGVVQDIQKNIICDRCKKPFVKQPNKVKVTSSNNTIGSRACASNTSNVSVMSSYKQEATENMEDVMACNETQTAEHFSTASRIAKTSGQIPQPRKILQLDFKTTRRSKLLEEPEILTLSSDDEDHPRGKVLSGSDHGSALAVVMSNTTALVSESAMVLTDSVDTIAGEKSSYLSGGGLSDSLHSSQTVSLCDDFVCLSCHKIHIGNFATSPVDRIYVTKDCIRFTVPTAAEGDTPATLELKYDWVVQILAWLKDNDPIIVLYMRPTYANKIKKSLKMSEENGYNLDPRSKDPKVQHVILQLNKISEDKVSTFESLFSSRKSKDGEPFLRHIPKDTTFDILLESLGKEENGGEPKKNARLATQTLLIYPPPPSTGGITVTTDDYYCLEEEQFLNDVILDFNLKYLVLKTLSGVDRERTHVFSTFFYKRLTSKPKKARRINSPEDDPSLTPAQKRHARVKSWTKNVDIFEKDFILIPINERSHWFLAVICFPGLDGPVRMDGGETPPQKEASKQLACKSRSKVEIPVVEDIEWSDKDEAEGDDEEMEESGGDEPQVNKNEEPCDVSPEKGHNQQHKQPCILIFDSLSGSNRSRIVATLRDYLSVEYFEKKKIKKSFTKNVMKGACPKVPQQTNFSDCGIFTLQFAESFFENPVNDFSFPIPTLSDWFPQERVACKREDIAVLIGQLKDEQKINQGITLPKLRFNSMAEEDQMKREHDCDGNEKAMFEICDIRSRKSSDECKSINEDHEENHSKTASGNSNIDKDEIILEKKCSKNIAPIPPMALKHRVVTLKAPSQRIPKKLPIRPRTPGPYITGNSIDPPESIIRSPLEGLYASDTILQRSIKNNSISIYRYDSDAHDSQSTQNVSSNYRMPHCSNKPSNNNNHHPGSSHNFRPTEDHNLDNKDTEPPVWSFEGCGKNSTEEEDDIIFDNEVLKPVFGMCQQLPQVELQNQASPTVAEVHAVDDSSPEPSASHWQSPSLLSGRTTASSAQRKRTTELKSQSVSGGEKKIKKYS